MYKITLNDGTVLDNLELNGNNFIAEGVIEDSVFTDNLATITITDGTTMETYEDMVLLSNRVDGGRSWFVLGEKTAQQKAMERATGRVTALEAKLSAMEAAYIEGVQEA